MITNVFNPWFIKINYDNCCCTKIKILTWLQWNVSLVSCVAIFPKICLSHRLLYLVFTDKNPRTVKEWHGLRLNSLCPSRISISTTARQSPAPRPTKRQIFKMKFITFRWRRKINFWGKKVLVAVGCRWGGVRAFLHNFACRLGLTDILQRYLIPLSPKRRISPNRTRQWKSCLGTLCLPLGLRCCRYKGCWHWDWHSLRRQSTTTTTKTISERTSEASAEWREVFNFHSTRLSFIHLGICYS